jgi:hypothetical protein
MSAWIVSRDHLDLLLTAALAWNLITAERADQTGRLLWTENLTSVAYRYPAARGQRPGPLDFRDRDVDAYRFQPYPGRIDPEVVAAAAESLECQSCEHRQWRTSTARRWVTRLAQHARARIPAYLTEHGLVDTTRQRRGEHGWYVRIDQDGAQHVQSGDGWCVQDRDVFTRAAALRTAPSRPPDTDTTPGPRRR